MHSPNIANHIPPHCLTPAPCHPYLPIAQPQPKTSTNLAICRTATYGSTISLTLRAGADSNNLDHITSIIDSTANDGSYTWTIPTTLEERDDYAIQIVAGNSANYSPRFEISKSGQHVEHTTSKSKTTKAASTTAEPTAVTATAYATVDVTTSVKATGAANATAKEPANAPTAAPLDKNSGAGKLGGSLMAAMVGIMGAVVLLN